MILKFIPMDKFPRITKKSMKSKIREGGRRHASTVVRTHYNLL